MPNLLTYLYFFANNKKEILTRATSINCVRQEHQRAINATIDLGSGHETIL